MEKSVHFGSSRGRCALEECSAKGAPKRAQFGFSPARTRKGSADQPACPPILMRCRFRRRNHGSIRRSRYGGRFRERLADRSKHRRMETCENICPAQFDGKRSNRQPAGGPHACGLRPRARAQAGNSIVSLCRSTAIGAGWPPRQSCTGLAANTGFTPRTHPVCTSFAGVELLRTSASYTPGGLSHAPPKSNPGPSETKKMGLRRLPGQAAAL